MNIVIIDNDTALLRGLTIILSREGFKVDSFDDPLEACAYVEQGGAVDVLIVDYVMPKLRGDEVLKRMKKHLRKECRVLLISGHSDIISPIDAEEMGVDAFLPKPIDIGLLSFLIKKCGSGEDRPLSPGRDSEKGKEPFIYLTSLKE